MKNRILFSIPLLSLILLSSCSTIQYETKLYRKELPFHDNYKIMLISDLLYSSSDNAKKEYTYLEKLIKSENNVDLIIFSGDTFFNASKSSVDYFFNFVDNFNIPFAFTYGEKTLVGQYESNYIARKLLNSKNAIFIDYSDDKITGLANYYIDLNDGNANKYRLFLIDSNSYHPTGFNYTLDTISKDQIEHLKNIYRSEVVPALAFFHTPLIEYTLGYEMYQNNLTLGQGVNLENVSTSYTDENKVFNWLKNCGVFANFVGHDYLNNSDVLYNNVFLSYGLKSSKLGVNNDSLVGYKLITLPNERNDFSLANIENKFVSYE